MFVLFESLNTYEILELVLFCTSMSILGSVFARAMVKLLSTARRFRCLVFIKTKAENPVSHKYVVENGIIIFKASEVILRLTRNRLTQNFSNVKRWKSSFMVESAFISRNSS